MENEHNSFSSTLLSQSCAPSLHAAVGGEAPADAGHPGCHAEVPVLLALPGAHLQLTGHQSTDA